METEEYTNEIAAEDSTETLVEEIHARRDSRPDDVIAMQSVLCILLALLLIAAVCSFVAVPLMIANTWLVSIMRTRSFSQHSTGFLWSS